jgi:hypothetical protein
VRIYDLTTSRERAQCAGIDAHEAAVAFDIGGEDRGELAFSVVGGDRSDSATVPEEPK